MSCCGNGTCVDPDCDLCQRVAKIHPPAACELTVNGKPCRLISGHPYVCQPSRAAKVEASELRDSVPVVAITNEQAAIQLAYKRRHHEGPVRRQR